MKIQGKVNSATIHTDNVDEASLSQIYNMLNIPCFANTDIVIMPDVHLGRGSVVGFTMTCNNYINPNVIGVDIGCGIDAYKIGQRKIDFEQFDSFIYSNIPAGSNIHSKINTRFVQEDKKLEKLIKKVAPQEHRRIIHSIGTLGGGNHFLELDKDENDNIWLIIHSGSRNLGLQVCHFHLRVTKQNLKEEFQGAGAYYGMEFISLDQGGDEYLHDMQIAQAYAVENRRVMAKIIVEEYFKLKFSDCEKVSSIHNYVNFKDNIIRKGAISAHKDERVIIPLNMRDGCLIARGKGNKDWNYSAPHGAGRLLKRSDTKELITLQEYEESMHGIYSSCINKGTLDESPMAYKDSTEILEAIHDTVQIEYKLKPIYNFKA
jgi:tRNA-splicing ligase RtcB (3'-phosphate/5'-hydroxy nucleic acid ligase)